MQISARARAYINIGITFTCAFTLLSREKSAVKRFYWLPVSHHLNNHFLSRLGDITSKMCGFFFYSLAREIYDLFGIYAVELVDR